MYNEKEGIIIVTYVFFTLLITLILKYDLHMMRTNRQALDKVGRIGLIAKGIVYVLLGTIGFMAAFELGKQANNKATSTGVFTAIQNLPAGVYILSILALGLVCYAIWRFVQAWVLTEQNAKKKWAKRIRYIASGFAYGSLAYTAFKIIVYSTSEKGDQNQQMASKILEQPFGQFLAIAVALLFAGIGGYQIYYGLSGKFKKHVSSLSQSAGRDLLLKSAKIGYTARGLVWLIIAYLFLRAGFHSDSSEAGDSAKAFQFIEATTFGSYLLGILAIGVIMYGSFNFIRARYENFKYTN